MKIAYISYEFPPETAYGGIGTYTQQVSSLLAAKGHHIEVFSCSHAADQFNLELDTGVLLHRVRAANRKEFSKRLLDIFSERHRLQSFDLVESPEYGAEGIEVKKHFPQLTMVVKLHSPLFLINELNKKYEFKPLKVRLKKLLGIKKYSRYSDPDYNLSVLANAVNSPSEALARQVKKRWALKRIDIVPYIYIPSIDYSTVGELTLNKRITFIGKLNVLKGMIAITKVIPLVLRKHPDAVFQFVGRDGPGPNGKESMMEYMKTQLSYCLQSIEFRGFVSGQEIPSVLAETNIVALTSLWENYPFACLEAMSAGRPVVGSSSGGIKEMLEHGKGGFIVDPYDIKAIALALNHLLDDPGLSMRMGAFNRLQVAELAATADRMTTAYYEQLIANRANTTYA